MVESKKVAEKSENSWKQKSCWKIWKPAVESENVIQEKFYFIGLKCERKSAIEQIVNLRKKMFISYSEVRRV